MSFPWQIVQQAAVKTTAILADYHSQRATYAQQKAMAEYNRKLQEYKNKMTMLSAAQQQNTITQNVTAAIQSSAMQATDIQKKVQEAVGATEVAAAATGTTGRSVDMAITNAERSGASQEYARQQQLQNVFDSADTQRQNVAMQAVMQQDLTWYQNPQAPNPILTAIKLGLGAADAMTSSGSSPPEGSVSRSDSGADSGSWSNFFGTLF